MTRLYLSPTCLVLDWPDWCFDLRANHPAVNWDPSLHTTVRHWVHL